MEATLFIQDLAVILVIGGIAGWIFQRLGLSTVAGYLIAGAIVGPHTPPFALVTDAPRVETLAQIGLVFLVFSIGLRLSLSRLRRLGGGLLAAVAGCAAIVFALARVVGTGVGLGNVEALFLAGLFMVSSSAIISRVLADERVTHERAGQLALGMTVLEDIVAVVMLTMLNSIVRFGDASISSEIGSTIGMLLTFVVLAGIAGLLIIPGLLRRMSVSASDELQALGIAGLLFGLAVLAQRAGYSTALGAFLLGTIVAETPHRAQVERLFDGMRDVFSAVFFVAIGMQIDPSGLLRSLWPIVGWTAFALLARPCAGAIGLYLVGTPLRDALRAGLMVTPIGEFSFVIVQLGVGAAVLPPDYYPTIVGVSLLTTLVAPFAVRHGDAIAASIERRLPQWLRDWLDGYQGWLERLVNRRKRNILWQLGRKRLLQISVGMLFVSGICVFSERLFEAFVEWAGPDWLFPHGPAIIFWGLLVLAALAPLVAIWRNLSAMALLFAEISARGHAHEARLRVVIEHGLKILAGAGLYVWLASILPIQETSHWLLYAVAVTAVVALVFLRRKLILWHSEAEVGLLAVLTPAYHAESVTTAPWLQSRREWNLAVMECVVPDLAECRGRSLRDLALRTHFGATVVGIERQGYLIPLPGPLEVLYPRDRVLVMGSPEQGKSAVAFLQRVSQQVEETSGVAEIRTERLVIPETSPASGATLGELSLSKRFNVILAAIVRGEEQITNPGAADQLRPGDEILALGNADQLRAFKEWLRG